MKLAICNHGAVVSTEEVLFYTYAVGLGHRKIAVCGLANANN